MAEKGFGVKEINLIGPSGTPTIESPNNLNLNANNVAISTNVSIGGTLSVTGNVSVGGTLTYEDVTNIDSVGLITARSGVVTPNVDVDDFITVGSNIQLGNAGVVTATTFSGSAASLTSIPAANITGTLPAISGANLTGITITPTNSDIQVAYTVTANGSSAYRFAGNGVVSTADNPDLYLIRGKKYSFINNSGRSHPFQIRESSGGTAYSTGVTNNGAASGNIDFAPTFDSPAQLVYQCTSHGGMVGNIYLRGGSGGETNVGITTFSGPVNVNGNLTQTGSGNIVHFINTGNNSGDNSTIAFGDSADVDAGHINYDHGTNAFQIRTNGANNSVIITNEGEMQLSGDANPVLSVNRGGSNTTNINIKYNGSTRSQLSAASNGFEISAVGSTAPIQFFTNGSERLRIASDGFVTFAADTDTGIKYTGTNTLQVHTNNTLCTEFAANQRVRMPQVYSTNGSNMRDVQIESDGTLCAGNTSVRAAKKNIASQTDVSWLYNLNPVTFNYRKHTVHPITGVNTYLEETLDETSYGLIAEEVESVNKDFCFYNDNKLEGVSYSQLITPLLKALQDQKTEIDDLKAKVATLEGS